MQSMSKEDREELMRYLFKERDLAEKSTLEKAEILVLHFIGYIPKPIGIDKETFENCVIAFNGSRGKYEKEVEAVKGVLDIQKLENQQGKEEGK